MPSFLAMLLTCKSILSVININTVAFFCLIFVWSLFYHVANSWHKGVMRLLLLQVMQLKLCNLTPGNLTPKPEFSTMLCPGMCFQPQNPGSTCLQSPSIEFLFHRDVYPVFATLYVFLSFSYCFFCIIATHFLTCSISCLTIFSEMASYVQSSLIRFNGCMVFHCTCFSCKLVSLIKMDTGYFQYFSLLPIILK